MLDGISTCQLDYDSHELLDEILPFAIQSYCGNNKNLLDRNELQFGADQLLLGGWPVRTKQWNA